MVLEGKYERYCVSCSRRSPGRKDLRCVLVSCDVDPAVVESFGQGGQGRNGLTRGWRGSRVGGQKIGGTSRGKGCVAGRVRRDLRSIV